jgi:hypothetical protein
VLGLATDPADTGIVREFFELFKTPWEVASPSRSYPVVLSTVGVPNNLQADQFIVYGSRDENSAAEDFVSAVPGRPLEVDCGGTSLPIYGRLALSRRRSESRLAYGGYSADDAGHLGPGRVRHIGYDLFEEVRLLLTEGQPPSMASTPTLELHIALLRRFLLDAGMSFVEIPPRPAGYEFICCLTHDVDFFGIRRHKFDRTLAGFLARATVGTLRDLARKRRPLREAVRNWVAVLSLPSIHAGLVEDFWKPFDDYAAIEDPRQSTFFLVPFKGKPGTAPDGSVHPDRAVRYEISDIAEQVEQGERRGSELAIHGIDAWRDASAGRAEMAQLTAVTGRPARGIRSHWLYFDSGAPAKLEAAEFEYDSTLGYNDAVGYRAGTSQAFRLPGCKTLMELPLSIMDSALFSSDRMGLTEGEAIECCRQIIANARQFGGTVVLNWHCRSLAPERLWGRFYQGLLNEISGGERAWFATAGQAVDWFRWRRSIQFEQTSAEAVEISADHRTSGPAGTIRLHLTGQHPTVRDLSFEGRVTRVGVPSPMAGHRATVEK